MRASTCPPGTTRRPVTSCSTRRTATRWPLSLSPGSTVSCGPEPEAMGHLRVCPMVAEQGHGLSQAARDRPDLLDTTSRSVWPLLDPQGPKLGRRVRVSRNEVDVEMRHAVAVHVAVHVFGPL